MHPHEGTRLEYVARPPTPEEAAAGAISASELVRVPHPKGQRLSRRVRKLLRRCDQLIREIESTQRRTAELIRRAEGR